MQHNQFAFNIPPQIYIGDLNSSIREPELYMKLRPYGEVSMIQLKYNKATNKSFAFVAFKDLDSSIKARQELNGTTLFNSVIRVCRITKDRNANANIFIKNIPLTATLQSLERHFHVFGSILSSKIVHSEQGAPLGYGFIQYEYVSEAVKAIKSMNGFKWDDCKLSVSEYLPVTSRSFSSKNNLYIKNFSINYTQEDIVNVFSQFGEIISVAIAVHNKTNAYGFVCFASEESANMACERLHKVKQDGFEWYVVHHMNRFTRKAYLRQQYLAQIEEWKLKNLYLKNLHFSICENKLRDIFSVYGKISSLKIVHTEHIKYNAEGEMHKEFKSTGVGFVCYYEEASATKALKDFQDKSIEGQKLFIVRWKPISELRAGIMRKKYLDNKNKVVLANQQLKMIVANKDAQNKNFRPVPMPIMRSPAPMLIAKDELGDKVYSECLKYVDSLLTIQVTKKIMELGTPAVSKLVENNARLKEKIFEIAEILKNDSSVARALN